MYFSINWQYLSLWDQSILEITQGLATSQILKRGRKINYLNGNVLGKAFPDDVTLSRSYLFSSDWFPELRLLEKHRLNNIKMTWYINQSFVSICFQKQKLWRQSEWGELWIGNLGDGGALWPVVGKKCFFFGMYNHILLWFWNVLFCIFLGRSQDVNMSSSNLWWATIISNIAIMIRKHQPLKICNFLIGSSFTIHHSSFIMVEDLPVAGSIVLQ